MGEALEKEFGRRCAINFSIKITHRHERQDISTRFSGNESNHLAAMKIID